MCRRFHGCSEDPPVERSRYQLRAINASDGSITGRTYRTCSISHRKWYCSLHWFFVAILLNSSLTLGAHVQQKTRTEDTGKLSQRVFAGDRMRKICLQLALGYACEGGHTEVAEVLINAGAPIDQAENEGRTPLMKASRAGHTCTVRYLISKGTTRRRWERLLHGYALFTGADVNRSTHSNDASVLSLACAGGHFEIATILLINGADPNHLLKVIQGETRPMNSYLYLFLSQDRSNCLIEAAKGGHTAIVQLLLEYPKSILTCTNHSLESQSVGHEAGQNEGENGDEDEDDDNDDDDEEEEEEDEDEDEDDDENSAAIMPNSFPLPSPPLNSSSFTHLENSDKLMPRKFLELLKNVKADSNELHSEIDAEGTVHRRTSVEMAGIPWNLDTPNCLLSDIDRIIASANDETPIEHSKQAIQLHLLGISSDPERRHDFSCSNYFRTTSTCRERNARQCSKPSDIEPRISSTSHWTHSEQSFLSSS